MATHAKNFDKQPVQKFGSQVEKPPKITVYKLTDKHDKGETFLIKNYKTMQQLLEKIAKTCNLLPAVRFLCLPNGKKVTSLDKLEDGGSYIAVPTGYVFKKDKVPLAFSSSSK
eukprot:gb/GECH01001653.1/.p1 GENE.gb/GECH01001653.1/~~gb/GECH01001653.1/.p1  ORF type:complete len:113 (+),score=33.06 gb/GECH01001653.1/:1-339(+)